MCGVEYSVDLDVDIFNIHVNDVVDVKVTNINGMGMFGKFQARRCLFRFTDKKRGRIRKDTSPGRFGGDGKDNRKTVTDGPLCVGTEEIERCDVTEPYLSLEC